MRELALSFTSFIREVLMACNGIGVVPKVLRL